MAASDSLRLTWFRGITSAAYRQNVATDRLLRAASNTVVGASADGFRLFCGDARDASSYFAHEADRFASAAFESMLTGGRNADYPRSTAWLLIRCYYAAFFAVHALLRIRGAACARISQSGLSNINREAALLFSEGPYPAGLYLITLDDDARTLDCRRLVVGSGGSHEALWSLLSPYLERVVEEVLEDSLGDHSELIVALDEFQRRISSKGGASWFTRLRNNVNYSHQMGAWFPYVGSTTDYDRVSAAAAGWHVWPQTLTTIADEAIQFANACSFLVSVCSTTVRDISYRSVAQSPFRKSSSLLLRGIE